MKKVAIEAVVDASITLSWFFEEERTVKSDPILDRVTSEGAHAPSLWKLEVANALQMALRRERIDIAFRDHALEHLEMMTIAIDRDTASQAWSTILDLAQRHDLKIYDATYLELAKRLGLPLATLDKAFQRAGPAESVPILGT